MLRAATGAIHQPDHAQHPQDQPSSGDDGCTSCTQPAKPVLYTQNKDQGDSQPQIAQQLHSLAERQISRIDEIQKVPDKRSL